METRIDKLKAIAAQLRLDAFNAVCNAKSGHLGGSFSCAEILAALYFDKMNIDPANPAWTDRDRFVLSKGHAGPILYAALARRGFFEMERLSRLRQVNCSLQGAASLDTEGCDFTTGPLGIGFSASVGMALGVRYLGKPAHVYSLLGDGEIDEGIIWEAAMSASKFQLGNLIAILDHNKVQQCGKTDDIMPLLDVGAKFSSFGFNVVHIDGHDMQQIIQAFDAIGNKPVGKPTIIIADTIKGKGVSFMEGSYAWHSGYPVGEEYERALTELKGAIL